MDTEHHNRAQGASNMTSKLTTALAALERVSKGEGVEKMNAEQLTTYAKEQLTKASTDADEGKARIAALTETVDAAMDVFKADPTAEVEVVLFVETPGENSNEALAKRMGSIESTLGDIKTLIAKQTDNDAPGKPTVTTVHPPPVPEGHDGGTVSTNLPQGDDNGARGEATKTDEEKVAEAKAAEEAAALEAGKTDEEKAAEAKKAAEAEEAKKAEEAAAAAAADNDPFVWPGDMNKDSYVDAQRKGLAKSEAHDAQRPAWGYDGESVPTG